MEQGDGAANRCWGWYKTMRFDWEAVPSIRTKESEKALLTTVRLCCEPRRVGHRAIRFVKSIGHSHGTDDFLGQTFCQGQREFSEKTIPN